MVFTTMRSLTYDEYLITKILFRAEHALRVNQIHVNIMRYCLSPPDSEKSYREIRRLSKKKENVGLQQIPTYPKIKRNLQTLKDQGIVERRAMPKGLDVWYLTKEAHDVFEKEHIEKTE